MMYPPLLKATYEHSTVSLIRENAIDIPCLTDMCVIFAVESLLTKYFGRGMEKYLCIGNYMFSRCRSYKIV